VIHGDTDAKYAGRTVSTLSVQAPPPGFRDAGQADERDDIRPTGCAHLTPADSASQSRVAHDPISNSAPAVSTPTASRAPSSTCAAADSSGCGGCRRTPSKHRAPREAYSIVLIPRPARRRPRQAPQDRGSRWLHSVRVRVDRHRRLRPEKSSGTPKSSPSGSLVSRSIAREPPKKPAATLR
jgi:hypothetical protein